MKILFFLLLSAGSVIAQHETNAEEENHHCLFKRNSITIGVGGAYSFVLEGVGVNTRAFYNVGERICFGPEFSYFQHEDRKIVDVNLIGHYIFETKFVGIYPLVGLNYTKETDEHESLEAYGAGIHRNIGAFTVFMEYSHVQSLLPDDFLCLGAMFTIK